MELATFELKKGTEVVVPEEAVFRLMDTKRAGEEGKRPVLFKLKRLEDGLVTFHTDFAEAANGIVVFTERGPLSKDVIHFEWAQQDEDGDWASEISFVDPDSIEDIDSDERAVDFSRC